MPTLRSKTTAARYRTLFELAPVGIIYADTDGRYLDVNAALGRMLGYERSELVGRTAVDIVAPEEIPEIAVALGQLNSDQGHRREWTFIRKDGERVIAEVTASRFADGTLVAMVQDLSELREHERELERISRLYAALSRINRAIVHCTTRSELLGQVCRVLVEAGGLRMAWIGSYEPATRRITLEAEWGDAVGELTKVALGESEQALMEGPTATALRAGYPYIANDLLEDPRTEPWRDRIEALGFRSSAAFPIRRQAETIGVISVYSSRADAFRAKEMGLLLEAAQNIGFALENFGREEARRTAESTLREEQEFSDTMIESMPGVLYFYDEVGRFLRWNRNFETVTGYSGAEIGRMHPTDFFAPGEKERVAERINEVFATGESGVEALFTRKDGRAIPYYFTGRRVVFQGRSCLVGIGIDISERLHAEEMLRESEARLLEAQRLAQLGSWELDLERSSLHLSDQLREMYGLGADGPDLDYEQFLALVHPDDRTFVARARHEVTGGAAQRDIEYRVLRRDGAEMVVDETSALRHGDGGRAVALAGIVHDVTDRARVAAERARRDRAETADRIKSAFLATMSHELRTPLNSIIGFTGILIQGLAGPLNAEQERQLDMVRGSARHLLALVNDVLDISKIEAGQLDVGRERIAVAAMIERLLAGVRVQAEAKGLTLRSELALDLGEIVSDQRRVEQILLNLLSNAIKFTERGEVRVTASRLANVPGLDGGAPGLCVRVHDTGIGIKPEHLPELFQPFRQLDDGLARSHEGTGLGLAICRRLATLLGGSVAAESTPGKGSTFTVILPSEGGLQ